MLHANSNRIINTNEWDWAAYPYKLVSTDIVVSLKLVGTDNYRKVNNSTIGSYASILSDVIYAPTLGVNAELEVRVVEDKSLAGVLNNTALSDNSNYNHNNNSNEHQSLIGGDDDLGGADSNAFSGLVALASAGISTGDESGSGTSMQFENKNNNNNNNNSDAYEGLYTITIPEDQDELRISALTGIANFTINFHPDFAKFYNKSFTLTVSQKMSNSKKKGSNLNLGETILPYISKPFKVSKHKLVILSSDPNSPVTWYKDEGGQNKSLEIIAYLKDSKSDFVTARQFPLKVTLVYEKTREPVPANLNGQSVLSIMSNSKLFIDSTGHAVIKFRITDVSNRHQGQKFQVLIAPDVGHSPIAADVAPIYSYPIDVKSKRKKEDKSGLPRNSFASGPLSVQDTITMESRNGSGKLDMISSVASTLVKHSTDGLGLGLGGRETLGKRVGNNDRCLRLPSNDDDDIDEGSALYKSAKRAKIGTGVTGRDDFDASSMIDLNLDVESRNGVILVSTAVSKVSQFIDLVMGDLDKISWKKSGSRSREDPTPQYIISNPNNLVSRINTEFHKRNIRDCIDLLSNCVTVMGAIGAVDMPARSGHVLEGHSSSSSARMGAFSPRAYEEQAEKALIEEGMISGYVDDDNNGGDDNDGDYKQGVVEEGSSLTSSRHTATYGRSTRGSIGSREHLYAADPADTDLVNAGLRAPKLMREHSLLGGGIN